MDLTKNIEVNYIRDGCYKYTFDAKKVATYVSSHCFGKCLNLFAGKNRLDIDEEIRVDIDPSVQVDYNMSAERYLDIAIDNKWYFDTVIYDPPWNERKSKEFYNGNYIGKFTKLKNSISKITKINGRIISVGYEILNFGKIRGFELRNLLVVDPGGEQRPYFVSIEEKIVEVDLVLWGRESQMRLDEFAFIKS